MLCILSYKACKLYVGWPWRNLNNESDCIILYIEKLHTKIHSGCVPTTLNRDCHTLTSTKSFLLTHFSEMKKDKNKNNDVTRVKTNLLCWLVHVLEVKGGFPHCIPVLTILLSLEDREDRASTPLPTGKRKQEKTPELIIVIHCYDKCKTGYEIYLFRTVLKFSII